MVEDTKP